MGVFTSLILILIIFKEKDILKENPSLTNLYLWTYRTYLFFLMYEFGLANLVIFRLGYLTNFIIKPKIRLEWIMDGLLLLVFIGLAVGLEVWLYFTTRFETGLVKRVKRFRHS